MMKHGAVITFAASLLFVTSAFLPHDLSAEGNVDMLKVVQVEQRILLFMDELDALSQSIPYSTKDQLKQSEKALAANSAKWNIYTQSVNEVIASDEELMNLSASYQEQSQAVLESVQTKMHELESFETFAASERTVGEYADDYDMMLEDAMKLSLLKQEAPLLDKLKVKEQLVFAEVTAAYEAAKAVAGDFPVMMDRMAALEESYILIKDKSEKIQAEEFKPFIERIKDYLLSLAAVAMLLMFVNMVQSKVQAYKQMKKSAEEYKKMMQGDQQDFPTI